MAGKTRRSQRKGSHKRGKRQQNISEGECRDSLPVLKPRSEKEIVGIPSQVHRDEERMKVVPIGSSRFQILPPIETTRPGSPKIQMNQSTKSLAYEILFERSRSRLEKQNSIALPPIASSDGVPTVVNTFLKKNYERLREERSGKCRKRAKTHTLYKDIDRGDAWELLKAEKIRNNELQKYQAKLKREKLLVQQQMMKRQNAGQRVAHRNKSSAKNYDELCSNDSSSDDFP
ncbi:uncharacterized protein LOC130641762 [Hydractinia symbiolongicarpus]|uniref:uncharacterized protein LOC130641762 n=1 Tax=Hydractinia symbiolongicarpus TaxID=13093 RepID=UPI00254C0504|nr:uncharacterized protein LOC130641762 [Hydractinia symbiolongicarpus]